MTITVTIEDELPAGQVVNALRFEVRAEQLTARELIRQRVYQEVQLYNLSTPGYFRGLVQPSQAGAAGRRLNQVTSP